MFKHPFSFKGRISRKEYEYTIWIGIMLQYVVLFVILLGIKYAISEPLQNLLMMLLMGFSIPYLWILVAQRFKRMNDLGKNPLCHFIPGIGLALMFVEGQPLDNRHGKMPESTITPQDMSVKAKRHLVIWQSGNFGKEKGL